MFGTATNLFYNPNLDWLLRSVKVFGTGTQIFSTKHQFFEGPDMYVIVELDGIFLNPKPGYWR